MPEYIPWYQPGAPLMQCAECYAVVVLGNIPGHDEWHAKLTGLIATAQFGEGEVSRGAADLPRQAG